MRDPGYDPGAIQNTIGANTGQIKEWCLVSTVLHNVNFLLLVVYYE